MWLPDYWADKRHFFTGLLGGRRYSAIITLDAVAQRIFELRGQRVILDSYLAALYRVPNKVLLQAGKRNAERFADVIFQVSYEEWENLRCQFGISSLRFQNGASKYGGRRYAPCAFTGEHATEGRL